MRHTVLNIFINTAQRRALLGGVLRRGFIIGGLFLHHRGICGGMGFFTFFTVEAAAGPLCGPAVRAGKRNA
jgi:hypothetical protein